MALGYDVTSSEYSWGALVASVDPNYARNDEWVYEFSNGKRYENSDDSDSGIYDGT